MLKHKVVIIQAYEFFPGFRLLRELSVLKRIKNLDIHVILWQRNEDAKFIGAYGDLTVHPIRLISKHGMSALEHIKFQPKFYKAVYQKLKAIKPDLIMAYNFDPMMPSAVYKLCTNTPVIYISREPYYKVFRMKTKSIFGQAIGWTMDALLAHAASQVVTVTPNLIKMYRRMGIRAAWFPNAPTALYYENPSEKSKRDYINVGFIGSMRAQVGIEEVWEAIKSLNSRKTIRYRLIVCGIPLGGFENVLQRMKSEDNDSIEIMAPVHPDRVPQLYRDIDISCVLLMPTWQNNKYGLNVKLYESLATGTPAIISNVGENAEFLAGIEATLLVNQLTVESIAENLSLLGDNPELRYRMGRNGRDFIMKEFNWEMREGHYEKIIKQCLPA